MATRSKQRHAAWLVPTSAIAPPVKAAPLRFWTTHFEDSTAELDFIMVTKMVPRYPYIMLTRAGAMCCGG